MRGVLTAVNGVSDVKTDLPTREATVKYDPGKTTPEKMAKLLTDHQGEHDFTATVKSS